MPSEKWRRSQGFSPQCIGKSSSREISIISGVRKKSSPVCAIFASPFDRLAEEARKGEHATRIKKVERISSQTCHFFLVAVVAKENFLSSNAHKRSHGRGPFFKNAFPSFFLPPHLHLLPQKKKESRVGRCFCYAPQRKAFGCVLIAPQGRSSKEEGEATQRSEQPSL